MILKKILLVALMLFIILCLFSWWEIYVPKDKASNQEVIYTAKKGMGDEDIARELQDQGIIKNSLFFRLYVVASGSHGKPQAGSYSLSPSMSIAQIVKKFVIGDVIKEKITLIEGWTLKDIAEYLEVKNRYSKEDFLVLTGKQNNWSQEFEFLRDLPPARAGGAQAGKPKNSSLEGYIFPDTYEISGQQLEDVLKNILINFDKKLTPDLRKEISFQHKSIFQIVTMASMLEKEVKSPEDKKIVAGILWKRIKEGVPLQVDATVNYATGKHDQKVAISDTKIDSRYNTYKYYGLPLGPISNPGMDSILAAIYPKKSDYWYYLSADGTGKTIFSKTLEEHNKARGKYLTNS